jgi:molybdopterin converting factor small subunit
MVLCQLVFYKILIKSDLQVSTLEWLEEIVLNTNIESIVIFDINLVGGDEVVVAPFLAVIIIATW